MATTRAQTLLLRIDSDMSKLRGELSRAEGQTLQTGERMAGSLNKIDLGFGKVTSAATLFRTTLVGVAVAGLGALALKAVDAASNIVKTADKIGLTTDELQEFRYAAERAGIAQETLDMAMQRFTRRTAEARNGTGEAMEALREMGVQLTDSQGRMRASGDILGSVAEAFEKIESPAERVRLAFKLFDSEGVAMVNVLAKGRAEFERVREEARAFGVVLDEKLLRDAERTKNQLTLLSRVVDANLNRALLALAPVIGDVARAFAEAAAAAGRFYQIAFTADESKSLDALEARREALMRQVEILREMDSLASKSSGGEVKNATVVRLETEIETLDRLIDKHRQATAARKGEPVINIYKDPNAESDLQKAADAEAKALEKSRDFVEQMKSEYARATDDQIYLIELRRRKNLEELEKQTLDEEEQAQARLLINMTADDAIAKHQEKLFEAERKQRRESMEFFESTLSRGIDSGISSLARLGTAGESTFDQLKAAGRSFVQDIYEGFLKLAVGNPLKNLLFGSNLPTLASLPNVFSLFGGGGSWTNVAGGVSTFTSLPMGFAEGGDHMGGFRIVGEKGPELEATGPSRIYNAAQTKDILSGARGGNVTVVQNFGGGVTRADLARIMPAWRDATIAAVREGRKRDPAFYGAAA